jgi:hypothetical protein
MSGMDAKPSSKRRSWPAAVVLVLFLLVMYVLGVGPAAYLASRGIVREDYAGIAYVPLFLAVDQSTTLTEATGWYINFWTPRERGVASSRR